MYVESTLSNLSLRENFSRPEDVMACQSSGERGREGKEEILMENTDVEKLERKNGRKREREREREVASGRWRYINGIANITVF